MDAAWRTDGGKTQSSNKHEMKTKEIREFPLCSLYLYFFWLAGIFCLRHLFGLWRSAQHAKKNTHISLEMFTVGPSQSRVPDNSHSRTPFLRQTLYRMPSLCIYNQMLCIYAQRSVLISFLWRISLCAIAAFYCYFNGHSCISFGRRVAMFLFVCFVSVFNRLDNWVWRVRLTI